MILKQRFLNDGVKVLWYQNSLKSSTIIILKNFYWKRLWLMVVKSFHSDGNKKVQQGSLMMVLKALCSNGTKKVPKWKY